MPASPDLQALYRDLAEDGWTDGELLRFIDAAHERGELDELVQAVYRAVLDPSLPEEDHSGDRFYEALAWYTDSTAGGRRDGVLGRRELAAAMDQQARRYLSLVGVQDADVSRMQAWKMVQKLRLLERELQARNLAGWPYRPREMGSIDYAEEWNRTHTIRSAAEFEARVVETSRALPVLVKFGLTYCAHCLLLEQLGAVPAVARRYAGRLHVRKLWWNPHDASFAELNEVARAQGVTSSPWFIVYKDGAAVRSGYAFPDETGEGMEELLEGLLPD